MVQRFLLTVCFSVQFKGGIIVSVDSRSTMGPYIGEWPIGFVAQVLFVFVLCCVVFTFCPQWCSVWVKQKRVCPNELCCNNVRRFQLQGAGLCCTMRIAVFGLLTHLYSGDRGIMAVLSH